MVSPRSLLQEHSTVLDAMILQPSSPSRVMSASSCNSLKKDLSVDADSPKEEDNWLLALLELAELLESFPKLRRVAIEVVVEFLRSKGEGRTQDAQVRSAQQVVVKLGRLLLSQNGAYQVS